LKVNSFQTLIHRPTSSRTSENKTESKNCWLK
jgi:hypothetical protein